MMPRTRTTNRIGAFIAIIFVLGVLDSRRASSQLRSTDQSQSRTAVTSQRKTVVSRRNTRALGWLNVGEWSGNAQAAEAVKRLSWRQLLE